MTGIFDRWVKDDIGEVFVQQFDTHTEDSIALFFFPGQAHAPLIPDQADTRIQ